MVFFSFKENKKETIFLLSFFIFILWGMFYNSMYLYKISNSLLNVFLYASISGFLVKIFFLEKYTRSQFVLYLLIGLLTFKVAKSTQYTELFYYTIVVLAAKDIHLEKIIKTFFYVSGISLVIIIISSKIGIIPDLLNYRDGIERHALGTMYSTNLSSKFFSLVISYIFLKNYKIKFIEYLVVIGISVYIYLESYGRLDFGCILIVLIWTLFMRLDNKYINKISGVIAVCGPCLCFFISYFFSKNYNSMSVVYDALDKVASGRLAIGNVALGIYDITKPFGQYVYSRGNGGTSGLNSSQYNYFYVDSSYLSIGLKYGLLFLILLLVLLTYKLLVAYQKKEWTILITVLIICINAIFADFLYTPFVNPFILILFCNIFTKNRELSYSARGGADIENDREQIQIKGIRK